MIYFNKEREEMIKDKYTQLCLYIRYAQAEKDNDITK